MLFKVSILRKFVETVTVSIFDVLIFVLLFPRFKDFGLYIFLGLFIIVLLYKFLHKNVYSIDNEMVKLERKNKIIPISSISYIEYSSHFRISGYLTGDGVKDLYYLVTKDSKKYKIDIRNVNDNKENLVQVLVSKYKKEISYL